MMRLPVGRFGGITAAGFKAVGKRFSNSDESAGLKYALCLENFTSAKELIKALIMYEKNTI